MWGPQTGNAVSANQRIRPTSQMKAKKKAAGGKRVQGDGKGRFVSGRGKKGQVGGTEGGPHRLGAENEKAETEEGKFLYVRLLTRLLEGPALRLGGGRR